MSEVVRLRGNAPIHHPGNPNKNLIRGLEWLLERAKAGELTGLAYSGVYFDGSTVDHYIGSTTQSMIGGLFSLATRLARKED